MWDTKPFKLEVITQIIMGIQNNKEIVTVCE